MRTRIALATVAIALAGAFAGGFSSGPLPGMSGAPNEFDCTLCHADYPLNSGTGAWSLTGPATVSAGETITIALAFTGPAAASPLHGFQMTAQDTSGNYIGTFTLTDPVGTQINSGVWVNHTSSGIYQTSWTVQWTAPSPMTSGHAVFYATGNEASGDGTPSFDYIYATSLSIPVYQPFAFTASTTGGGAGDFSGLLSGARLAGAPLEAGNLGVVLVTLDPNPGYLFGLTPDALTWAIIAAPFGSLPFFNQFLAGPATTNTAAYPAGTLSAFAGVPIRLVGLTLNLSTTTLVGLSPVVTIVP